MPQIATNSVVMREKANSLKTVASSIKTIAGEMKNEINRLKSTWEGEAAEQLVNNFNQMLLSFDERYDVINSYADFLLNAAQAYEDAENSSKRI